MQTTALSANGAPLTVRSVTLDQIIDLRWRVLRTNQPRHTVIFPGDELPTTLHVGVFAGPILIGCASLHQSTFQDRPAWQLRGVAVDPAWRHQHIGQTLMQVIEDHVRAHGPSLLWANARLTALGFYQRLGWQVLSEPFDIPIAGPHVRIRRDLSDPA